MAALSKPRYLYDKMELVFGEKRSQAGEVGVEIEVEGKNLLPTVSKFWVAHTDGSLRGENLEYVFNVPLVRQDVRPALDLLKVEMDAFGSKPKDSYRTSVHVHVNQQQRTVVKVFNNILLYMLLEEPLVEYCGVDRVGNLFCLRANDARFSVKALRDALRHSEYSGMMSQESLRYLSCNFTALRKFNSLEFRAMRGTTDPTLISNWVDVLLDIKDVSDKFDTPMDIHKDIVAKGTDAFLRQHFTDQTCAVIMGVKGYGAKIKEGIRTVQDVVYCCDWTKQAEVPEKKSKKARDADTWGIDDWAARVEAAPAMAPAPPRGYRGAEVNLHGIATNARNLINNNMFDDQ